MSKHRRLVLATNNAGKIDELRKLLADLPVELVGMRDAIGSVDIPEPFATFHENASHKALTAAGLAGAWALAEDSGLVVDALGGRPGVYSARFAGKHASDPERVSRLLALMAGVRRANRSARFRCEAALAAPGRLLGRWGGTCEGAIAEAPRGEAGFGYDPVFFAAGESRTNAELSREEKGAISHRGAAIRCFVADLPGILRGS